MRADKLDFISQTAPAAELSGNRRDLLSKGAGGRWGEDRAENQNVVITIRILIEVGQKTEPANVGPTLTDADPFII